MDGNQEHKHRHVGIDISAKELVVAIGSEGPVWQIVNDDAGVAELIKRLRVEEPTLIVMEPTGGYEIPLAAALGLAKFAVAVVNARQIRDFAKARGRLAKTDKIDARTIADFAETMKPEPRPLKDEETREIDALVRRRKQLQEAVITENNRLRTAFHRREQESIKRHVGWLERELKELEKELQQRIKTSPLWRELDMLIQSVPGVGKILSMTLIAGLPELGKLGRAEIAALVGVAPFNCDSGKQRGERHIRGGRHDIRRALFCTTRAAITHGYNPLLAAQYERLQAAGKLKKVAQVACMRKLLTILNAIVGSRTPWRNPA